MRGQTLSDSLNKIIFNLKGLTTREVCEIILDDMNFADQVTDAIKDEYNYKIVGHKSIKQNIHIYIEVI